MNFRMEAKTDIAKPAGLNQITPICCERCVEMCRIKDEETTRNKAQRAKRQDRGISSISHDLGRKRGELETGTK